MDHQINRTRHLSITSVYILMFFFVGCKEDFLVPNSEDCTPLPETRNVGGYTETQSYGDYYFLEPDFNPNNSDEFTFSYEESSGGVRKIGIGSLEKGTFRYLTNGYEPRWGSQGEICFHKGQDEIGIWKIDIDGSNEVRLTDFPFSYSPFWSRDGEKIIFYEIHSSGWFPKIMNKDGSDLKDIKLPGLRGASWSHDGRYIAGGWADDIYIYDVETKESVKLDGLKPKLGEIKSVIWGQDDLTLYIVSWIGITKYDFPTQRESLIWRACDQRRLYMESSINPEGTQLLGRRIDKRRINSSTLEMAIKLWMMDVDGSNEELIELTKE